MFMTFLSFDTAKISLDNIYTHSLNKEFFVKYRKFFLRAKTEK